MCVPFTVTVVSGKMADCPKKSMTNVLEGSIIAWLAQTVGHLRAVGTVSPLEREARERTDISLIVPKWAIINSGALLAAAQRKLFLELWVIIQVQVHYLARDFFIIVQKPVLKLTFHSSKRVLTVSYLCPLLWQVKYYDLQKGISTRLCGPSVSS